MFVRIASLMGACVLLGACSVLPPVTPYGGGPSVARASVPAATSVRGPSAASPSADRPMIYRFGIGDEVGIDVWQEKELSTTQRVLPDGTVSPMLIGTVRVLGQTIDEVRTQLTRRYTEYLKDPQVSVRVTGIYTDRVFVLGEVGEPQAVTLLGPLSVVQALSQAGGLLEEFADKEEVRLIRRGAGGQPVISVVNVEAVLEGRASDTSLQRGDILYVPARGVTNWSRSVGQALSPFSLALGAAGSAAAVATVFDSSP